MSFDPHRRSSVEPGLQVPSTAVQEQRYAEVARNVLDKLRYGSRRATAQRQKDDDAAAALSYGTTTSQSTKFETGCKIRALDINESKTHAILAGGKILKTLKVEGGSSPTCTEEFDLRTAPVRYDLDSRSQGNIVRGGPSHHRSKVSSTHRESYDVEDVAWSNGIYSRYIATAAANGKIMLYDVENASVGIACLHEHYRQVHKVDFNPMEGAFLLSGSQDGTVRLWDLRNPTRDVMLTESKQTFPGRADGVRHVKWSPRNTWSFAFGTDSGTIQRWDTRNSSAPVLKISGHAETCNSVDWHPDGKHLVSGGRDQYVKVWNLSPETRRQRPVYSFRTPQEVQNVRWRPAHIFLDAQAQNTKQCTQLATSYRRYPVVHLWDLRRPLLPFREIHHKINSGTTDMLWQSENRLWTVGPEGTFNQTDVYFAPVTLERRPLSTFSCAPSAELALCLEARPGLRAGDQSLRVAAGVPFGQQEPDSPEKQVLGRSPGDDGFDEHFIPSDSPRSRHSRTPSTKSVKSAGVIMPIAEDVAKMPTVDLDLAINTASVFRLHQVPAQGPAPGTMSSPIFSFLAQKYKIKTLTHQPTVEFFQRCEDLFEQNAGYVQRASFYRDAQSWRILGRLICQELKQRAESNRKRRLERAAAGERSNIETNTPMKSTANTFDTSKNAHDSNVKLTPARALDKFRSTESSSNVATPLARPVEIASSVLATEPFSESPTGGGLQLPPSLASEHLSKQPHKRHSPSDGRVKSAQTSSNWNNHVSEIDEKRAAMNEWKAPPKLPLTLDAPLQRSSNIDVPPRLDRQNSADSFMMFSTSSSSQPRISAAGSLVSGLSQSTGLKTDSLEENFSGESLSLKDTTSPQTDSPFLEDSFKQPVAFGASAGNVRQLKSESSEGLSGRSSNHREDTWPVSTDENYAPTFMNPIERDFSAKPPAIVQDPPADCPADVHFARQNTKPCAVQLPTIDRRSNSGPQRKSILLDQRTKSAPGAVPVATIESERDLDSQDFVVSDFLESPSAGGDLKIVSALEALRELLKWYTARGNAQMAANLLLVSLPLLNLRASPSNDDSRPDGADHFSGYAEYLTSTISVSHEEASSIVTSMHKPLEAAKLSPLWIESLLSTYHEQLVALRLLNPATELRRLSYPAFPAVYEQSLKDVQIGMLCLNCSKPINNPTNKMRCETCHAKQAECAICLCAESPFKLPIQAPASKKAKANKRPSQSQNDNQPQAPPPSPGSKPPPPGPEPTADIAAPSASPSSSLWTTCPLCNHSTHAACAFAWHADRDSGGACSVPACLCDCAPGAYRCRRLASREHAERQKKKTVRRDDWNVGESRAVGRVRGALRGSGSWSSDTERGDEGKRVRVLVPSAERGRRR